MAHKGQRQIERLAEASLKKRREMQRKNLLIEEIKLNTCKAMDLTSLDPEVWQKSLAKAKRWMKLAYGSLDYAEYLRECGDISYYYKETIADPTGKDTFHHEMAQQRRRDGWR